MTSPVQQNIPNSLNVVELGNFLSTPIPARDYLLYCGWACLESTMIAKAVKGKGFRGALEYALRQEKGCILDSNMAGDNPRTLAREFGEIRALRPNVTKAVLHVSISVAPNERLTDEQWCEVAHKYLDGMGFKESQYIAVKHTDTGHPHIHIIANRVSVTGEVVSDSHDYKRQEVIMRQLEQEYDLSTVKNSKESERKALNKGEIEHVLRTGEKSARMQLQGIVDSALKDAPNLPLFIQRLETDGVSVKLNQTTTEKISGISFSLGNVAMKGSDLGKAYTWNSLQKRGLTYEQDGYSARHEFGRNPEKGTAETGFDRSGNAGEKMFPDDVFALHQWSSFIDILRVAMQRGSHPSGTA